MSFSEAPNKTIQGALIQLYPGNGLVGIANAVPNIVQFDINPNTLTRSYSPWKPETQTSAPAPGAAVQPITVPEKFTGFKIELDPYAAKSSLIPIYFATVEARISALRKMIRPSQGLVGDLVQSVADLVGAETDYTPPEIAPVILWLGNRIVLPVQIEKFDVVEHQHDQLYYPVRASVTLEMTVMTPDKFRCTDSPVAQIAIATYEYTKSLEDLSAIASAADLSPLWRLVVPV
jgi:hypothetical protein